MHVKPDKVHSVDAPSAPCVPGVRGRSGAEAFCGTHVKPLLDENVSDRIVQQALIYSLIPRPSRLSASTKPMIASSGPGRSSKDSRSQKRCDQVGRTIAHSQPHGFWGKPEQHGPLTKVCILREGSHHQVIRQLIASETESLLVLER